MDSNRAEQPKTGSLPQAAKLIAYYLSRGRVLSLFNSADLPGLLHQSLQCMEAPMTSAVLSNTVGEHLLKAIANGGIRTLQQLVMDGSLAEGALFIYNGHFYGKGFGANNKKPFLTLTERLDEPLEDKKLVLEFSKNGLINDTAYTRMSGSTRLFAYAYVAEITKDTVRAIPYVIGDLVTSRLSLPLPFTSTLELRLDEIQQFSYIDCTWTPSKEEFAYLADVSERKVKETIARLLGEHDVPADWGGEESDLFSGELLVAGRRHTGAFLLKGPAKFHQMTPKDLGKNADQVYRLFNIPADIYVIQHCHTVGPAVRKTVEAFAFHRSLTATCRYVIIDGYNTARLLRAANEWPASKVPSKKVRGERS